MKKQEKGQTVAKPGVPASSTSATMGVKHSKSEHSGLSSQGSAKSRPLSKAYLSKSHENLSSHQKKKLSTVMEQPSAKPKSGAKSSESTKSVDKNKENVALKEKEKNSGSVRAKPNKPTSLATTSTIRKASSTQSIDKTSISSASSVSGSLSKTQSTNNGQKSLSIKRAQSTQNVSKDKLTRKRTSAPADVMAYNAELLANFEKDKKIQETRISELIQKAEGRKAEIEKLKYENKRLKDQIPSIDTKEELDFLRNQNKNLLDRLKELGIPVEQITDAEKISMLKKSVNVSKNNKSGEATPDSNIPNSASCDSLSTDGAKGPPVSSGVKSIERSASVSASEPGLSLADLCGTPDHPSILSLDQSNWEKQSNKSGQSDGLSEISVACLTERIILMEETNYSTTEELQATLQELGDLQDAVNELTEENERLADEKAVLLESLCTQTEKLENTRIQVEQLKSLLLSGNLPDISKREELLIDSLKSAQEEREELMMKLTEHANTLHTVENEFKEVYDVNEALRDKSLLLEDKIVGIKSEKDLLEQHGAEMREIVSTDQIEIKRLRTLLENEKAKVSELEQFHKATDKSDLETLMDNARQEKDKAEEKLANVQDALAHSECEVKKLKEHLQTKEEEMKVVKNNSKMQVSDLEYKVSNLEKGRNDLQQEVEALRDHIDQLEIDCNRYQDEEKYHGTTIQELQKELSQVKQRNDTLVNELHEAKNVHATDEEEWKQFQKDLQVAVVIANDFRSETQETMEELRNQNSMLKDKVRHLESIVDKLRADLDLATIQKYSTESKMSKSILTNAELKGKVLCSVDRELSVLRDVRRIDPKNQSLSVKSLIRSIETQVKSGCSSIHSSHGSSRRNSDSNDSLFSIQDYIKSPTSPTKDSPLSPPCETHLKSALKKANDKPSQRHSFVDLHRSPSDQPKSMPPFVRSDSEHCKVSPTISSILQNRQDRSTPRRNSGTSNVDTDKKDTSGKDPLSYLAKQMGGSKRNALLKWCQQKTLSYKGVDITNFSSSWNDGLAFCAILHNYLPHKIPYNDLDAEDKRKNFTLAFNAGEEEGIPKTLCINDMVAMERPDWQAVMCYVTAIYKHFEMDTK
ncbi:cytospin-A isoform X2 [Patella vulgata]|nr:cytospin-A isoform X2 [Patella vulgata]XP_050411239.1 cytospin-A isoform X2 [Patella vulgata]XP_050411240.1 cytospin-A isoform X2 [Patella vulgata]XP_050411241.1 cytospin-A isoform X2 [Patella vulgata]XP_050411242.1 cytospin-A isoform X2 [Patella vulgata]XP_050411243.1 cytospin-A isoform X2 [Patella vulgata]